MLWYLFVKYLIVIMLYILYYVFPNVVIKFVYFYYLFLKVLENITVLGLFLTIIGSTFLVKAIIAKLPSTLAKESSLDITPVYGGSRELNPIALTSSIYLRWDACTGLVFIIFGIFLQILGELLVVSKSHSRMLFVISLLLSLAVIICHFLLKGKYYSKNLKRCLLAYHAEYRLPLGDKYVVGLLREVFRTALPETSAKDCFKFLDKEAREAGFEIKSKEDKFEKFGKD